VKKQDVKTLKAIDFWKMFIVNNLNTENYLKKNLEHFFCIKLEEHNFKKLPILSIKQSNYTILFVTSGNHTSRIGYKEYNIRTNELIIIPSGQIFSIESIAKGSTGFIVQFSYEFLMGKYVTKAMLPIFDFIEIWENSYFKLNTKEVEFISNILNRLYYEEISNTVVNKNIVQPYLVTLLCEINGFIKNKSDIYYSLAATRLVLKFKELVYSQMKITKEIGFFASRLNVTPNHLNKSVKLVTGKTSKQWIDEVVLIEAKYLLSRTNLAISDVAMELGYSDHSYFSRFFKKHENLSPVQFRNMIELS